jgi:hypothetical protein
MKALERYYYVTRRNDLKAAGMPHYAAQRCALYVLHYGERVVSVRRVAKGWTVKTDDRELSVW